MNCSFRNLGNQEETRHKRREDHHVLNQQFCFLVAITQQQVTPSTRHDPACSSLLTDDESKDKCYIYPNISQKIRGTTTQYWSGKHFFCRKRNQERPCCGNNTFFGCNRCGQDPHAKDKTRRANDSKPKRHHNVFTHFPKDSNCELCNMTKTTHARCINRPLKRNDDIPPPTFVRDLLTADHNILNLVDESRRGHQNALIVQDGYSYWSQSYPTKGNAAQETSSCLRTLLTVDGLRQKRRGLW